MRKVEIPCEQWREVLPRFSREHRGWLSSIIRVTDADDDAGHLVAQQQPLQEVVIEPTGQGEAMLTIVAGTEGQRVADRLLNPSHIALERTDDGADSGLRIESQDGVVTRVRFDTPARPDTLDGLADSER